MLGISIPHLHFHPQIAFTMNPETILLTPRSMVFWRHIIGIAIILLIQHPRLYGNGMMFLGLWSGTVAIAFIGAGLIVGLGCLFLTTKTKGKAWRIFVVIAWCFAILQLFGEWALPTIVSNIATTSPKVLPTASSQQAPASAIASHEIPRAGFNYDADGNPLINFDVDGALKAGHSKSEIAEYLCNKRNLDIAVIRGRGYTDDEIIAKLVGWADAGSPTQH
ncbi:hypothetical protein MTYP_03024 [Methylophilaceae bacterium]|nr:hypothetical protein MTYP_03024 [Methylophilaceae bacterium]